MNRSEGDTAVDAMGNAMGNVRLAVKIASAASSKVAADKTEIVDIANAANSVTRGWARATAAVADAIAAAERMSRL